MVQTTLSFDDDIVNVDLTYEPCYSANPVGIRADIGILIGILKFISPHININITKSDVCSLCHKINITIVQYHLVWARGDTVQG